MGRLIRRLRGIWRIKQGWNGVELWIRGPVERVGCCSLRERIAARGKGEWEVESLRPKMRGLRECSGSNGSGEHGWREKSSPSLR